MNTSKENHSTDSSLFKVVFWGIFGLGNLVLLRLTYNLFGKIPPVTVLVQFVFANFTDLVIFEIVCFCLAIVGGTVFSRSASTKHNRVAEEIKEIQNHGESSALPEDSKAVKRIVRALPFRPTAQMVWRLQVFSKWLFLGWLVLLFIWGIFYLLSQTVFPELPQLSQPLSIAALVWIIVPLLVANYSYVIPEYQRLIALRMGKVRPELSGKVSLVPFADEVRFIVDMREVPIPVQFNQISFRSSTTGGYVIANPEITLYVTAIPGRAHLAATLQQNPEYSVRKNAETDLRRAAKEFTIDDLLSGSDALLNKVDEILRGHTESWGVRARPEISDHGLPDTIRIAFERAEAAEVEGVAMVKLASATDRVMEEWTKAISKHIADITREEKIDILKELIGVERAKALAGERGGVTPVVEVSPLIGGLGKSTSRTGSEV